MFHKIHVHGSVGKGEKYLIITNKDINTMHKELHEKFEKEVGSVVYITYLDEWRVQDVPMDVVGEIERIIYL